MGGLLVFTLIGLYVWGAYWIVRRTPPIWGKALVLIVAILIPTADAVYGRYKLKEMCEAEGGLRIYRVVEGVAGFDNPKATPIEQWLNREGYKFIEGEELSGKRSRLSLRPDGTVFREVEITPISEYVYGLKSGSSSDIFLRIEQSIRVRSTGEVLGRVLNISYSGGWFERFVAGIYAARGTAGTCGPDIYITELVKKTLKPLE